MITQLKTVESRIIACISACYSDDSGIAWYRTTPFLGVYWVMMKSGTFFSVGGVKECSRCGQVKSQFDFNIRNKSNDGLSHYCKDCQSAYYQENKQRYNEYYAEYRRKYPEKRRAATIGHNHKRRAKKRGNGGTYTAKDLAAVRASQTDKHGRLICWKCCKPIIGNEPPPHLPNGSRVPPALDHWIPLDKGGSNDAGNLHYMHGLCNMSKGAKMPHEIGRLL